MLEKLGGDRTARIMGAGSYEARRDFASGGMNMYGGYGSALRAVNNPVPSTLARVVAAHIEELQVQPKSL